MFKIVSDHSMMRPTRGGFVGYKDKGPIYDLKMLNVDPWLSDRKSLTIKRFRLDAEQTWAFFLASLRDLDQGIPSDPSRHGSSLEPAKSGSRPLGDNQSRTPSEKIMNLLLYRARASLKWRVTRFAPRRPIMTGRRLMSN